jgi:hypothetical protein
MLESAKQSHAAELAEKEREIARLRGELERLTSDGTTRAA